MLVTTFILSQPLKLKSRMKLELKSFGDLSSLIDLLLTAQSAVNKKKVMTLVSPQFGIKGVGKK